MTAPGSRPTKPASAFVKGDRIRFKGKNATVTESFYLSGRKEFSLGIKPDDESMGDRVIYQSREYLEVGDPLSGWSRLRARLLRRR